MLRLTMATKAVLRALTDGQPHYGTEIAETTGQDTGTVAPILRRIADHGLAGVTAEDTDPSVLGRPQRLYYQASPAQVAAITDLLGGQR